MNNKDKIEEIALLELKEGQKKQNLCLYWFNIFYAWQIEFCASTLLKFESCLMAANQIGKCVSFQTLIETEHGPKRIGDIFGSKIKVKTHPNNELRKVNAWVMKPPEECYRITLDDGSWVEVPLGHKILVGSDYLTVDELFQVLPESVFSRPQSSSVFSRLVHTSSVQRLMGKCVDSIRHCLVGLRLNDAQLLSDQDNVQVYSPLQGDVQPHTSRLLRLGDLVYRHIYNLFDRLFHPSSPGVCTQILGQSSWPLIPSLLYVYRPYHESNQDRLLFHAEKCHETRELLSCHLNPQSFSYPPPNKPSFAVSRIVSVYPVGVKTLYDMEVDERHNYIAGGLVHHNTLVGTVIDAFHLMGNYPDNWPGHRFKHAPLVWCLGVSTEKTRDLLQTALFGKYDKLNGFKGGLVPKDKIVDWESISGVSNAMRTVRVKHASGGISRAQFWSYSQGQDVLMGDKVDHCHIDEDPKDPKIRPQLVTRTINGDKGRGGKIIYTFTPEHGRTDTVIKFMDNPSPSQFFMQKGWVDAPHMTQDKQDRLMEQYDSSQIDMRSKGDPLLGEGRIFDISEDVIECDPFEIPDFWKTICCCDFGGMGSGAHPQAFAKLVHDPESDTVYLTNSWKASGVSAPDARAAVKSWVGAYPVAWPHDGLHMEKARDDSIQLKQHYVNAGFNMLFEHATWLEGGISVEAGIYQIITRARQGRFRVFKGQPGFLEEWRQYHRVNGKIVKVRDDILDSIRTGIMMLRCAIYCGDCNLIIKSVRPEPIGVMGKR